MSNRGFRLILSVFSSLLIFMICLNINLNKIEGKTKEVKNSFEEIDVSNFSQDLDNKEYIIKLVKENKYISDEVILINNIYRGEVGVPNLEYSEDLSISATIRAIEIATTFSHIRPDGTNFSTSVNTKNTNIRYIGENIAYGYDDINEVCEAWKNSKGHYQNMIDKRYKKIGIGYFKYKGVIYWSQIFTN